MKDRSWPYFILSLLLPVIGGLITYFMKRRTDRDVSVVCLIGSIWQPTTAGYLILLTSLFISSFFGYIFQVVLSVSFLAIFVSILLLTIKLFLNTFSNNKYKYFISIFWAGLIGFLYHRNRYSNDEILKTNFRNFVIAGLIVSFILTFIVPVQFNYEFLIELVNEPPSPCTAQIINVFYNSPAMKIGISPGEYILSFDGKPPFVSFPEEKTVVYMLPKYMSEKSPGEKLVIKTDINEYEITLENNQFYNSPYIGIYISSKIRGLC